MRIYAIANQKGGVGKTTSAANLAAVASERGERVLLVDLDPHAGLTTSLGLNPESFERTVYQVLLGEASLDDAAHETTLPGVRLVPANMNLAGAEAELIGEIDWAHILKVALESVAARYDKVFLDCPPALGVLTTNALVAADTVIVPLQCEYLAMRGLKQLQVIIKKVQAKANPGLEIRILRTMFDPRTTHGREVSEEIVKVFGAAVFAPIIRRSIKFADSTVAGQPVLTYAPTSEVADAYRQLAAEI